MYPPTSCNLRGCTKRTPLYQRRELTLPIPSEGNSEGNFLTYRKIPQKRVLQKYNKSTAKKALFDVTKAEQNHLKNYSYNLLQL